MCTETKDARVHCTILNDHTNRHHDTTHNPREAGERSPLETNNGHPDTPKQQWRPVVLSGPNSVLPTDPYQPEPAGTSGIPHFSSNPLPPPQPQSEDRLGEVLGPSTTNPRAQNIRL